MSHQHWRRIFNTSKEKICRDCGALLCTHHKGSLKGCLLDKGHAGPHSNVNDPKNDTWTDEEGLYINNQEDWVRLVNYLGNPNSPFKSSCAPKGQTLEEAFDELEENQAEVFRNIAILEAQEKSKKLH